jgi:hypothetical protein
MSHIGPCPPTKKIVSNVLFHVRQPNGLRKRLLRGRIFFESRLSLGLVLRQITFRIDRRLPALRRRERQLHASVAKDKIRRREFLEPKPSLLACVAQLVMRGQHHENFHLLFLSKQKRSRLVTAIY